MLDMEVRCLMVIDGSIFTILLWKHCFPTFLGEFEFGNA